MSVSTAILQVLFNAQPARLTETNLLAEVRFAAGGCGESEFRRSMQTLRIAGMVSSEIDEITDDTFWKIEAKGIARIRGAR